MLTIIVFTLVPVDFLVHRYNVAKVNAGYWHPAVMIAVKPINNEGILPLLHLTECEDATIRRGVLALLAERQQAIQLAEHAHWTEFQGATYVLRQRLGEQQAKWSDFQDPAARTEALREFRRFAMQWY